MAEEFTKEQKGQLTNWVIQRDSLLNEISNLRDIESNIRRVNKELANSNSDIEYRMNVIQGRIEELKIKEADLSKVISKEVAELKTKKSTLEAEINNLSKLLNVLTPQKTSLESDIEKALTTFEAIKGESLLLNKVVDKVTVVSKTNSDKIDLLVSNLAKSLEEIIKVNKKNVFETNVVIEKLPVILMELQKHGLIKNRQSIIKK